MDYVIVGEAGWSLGYYHQDVGLWCSCLVSSGSAFLFPTILPLLQWCNAEHSQVACLPPL